MAIIVVLGGGVTGFTAAILLLCLGFHVWAAIITWMAVGIGFTVIAGLLALLPHRQHQELKVQN